MRVRLTPKPRVHSLSAVGQGGAEIEFGWWGEAGLDLAGAGDLGGEGEGGGVRVV